MFGFNETTTTTTANLQSNTNNQIMSSSGNFDSAPSNQSNNHIFAFKNSSHAMSITKYNREKNNETYSDQCSILNDFKFIN